MIQIISYAAWFNIFAMAFQLIGDPMWQDSIFLKQRKGSLSEVNLISGQSQEAMFIEFYSHDNNLILSYVMIPWQNMSSKTQGKPDELLAIFPEAQFYTVTPFAVIYKIEPHASSPNHREIKHHIDKEARRIFDSEETESTIEIRDGYTLSSGLQVMNMTEHLHYAEIRAALPGSKNPDLGKLQSLFPGKMICLTLVKDTGPTVTHWIGSSEGGLGKEIQPIEKEIAAIYLEAMYQYKKDKSKENKKLAFEQAYNMLMELFDLHGYSNASIPEYYTNLLERLLSYKAVEDIPFDPETPFPDYTPKMTPDELLDFMPEISDIYNNLPGPQLENLPELIGLYKQYKKSTKQNPGTWVQGNPVLGSKSEEYQATKDELLLSEIGERIRLIATNEGSKNVKAVLKGNKNKKKKIKYNRLSYTHMDVMGSGRYFYVEEIEAVNLKLF